MFINSARYVCISNVCNDLLSRFWILLKFHWNAVNLQCYINFCSTAVIRLCALVAQACLTLCDPMDCNPPGFSVRGILQAKIQEWVAKPSSRESSWPRDQTQISSIASGLLTIWVTRQAFVIQLNLHIKHTLFHCSLSQDTDLYSRSSLSIHPV